MTPTTHSLHTAHAVVGVTRARTACAMPGCPRPAVSRGRCDAHARRYSGHQWRRLVRQVVARDHGVCWLCGNAGATSADHVVRWADGGSDDISNLRAVHIDCNNRRRRDDAA